ncbi:MAG: hypothetical protein AAFX50_04080 [Acidobacteriota bacterium]
MKTRWTILCIALLSLLAFPAAGQEEIIGFFEGVQGSLNNAGTGSTGLTGWALASSGVQRVEILVDGVVIGQARYGGPRTQVEEFFPGFPDSPGAGFVYQLNTTDFTNGTHHVQARVVTNLGNVELLETAEGNAATVLFNNNTAILAPFGEIDKPLRNAFIYGTCNRFCGIEPEPNILTPVTGYALDLGVEIGDAGVGYVELMLNGSLLYNTRTDCTFRPGLGLHQCYGLPRLDVEHRFPFALNAPNAGYRFLMDVGELITCFGYPRGQQTLTIRSGDISTQVANIDEIPVFMQCVEDLAPGSGTVGNIESPIEGFQYAGVVDFEGWALAIAGVARVEVFIDGLLFGGVASFGVDTRPGVAAEYPGYPDADAPVWRLSFDTTTISDGDHQIQVFVEDLLGARTEIGERTFFVNNDDGDF